MNAIKKISKKMKEDRKHKNDFLLISFSKALTGEQKEGKILMQGKTENGFIEKMIKVGFETKVFEFQYTKNGVRYSMQIGRFYDEIANKKLNKEIADSILPFIQLIKNKIQPDENRT